MSGKIRFYKVFILFLLAMFFYAANSFSQERYWVNGSGSWNDPSHWALTSGGEGGAEIPTSSDDVIIDHNSFSSSNQYIEVEGKASCKNLIWKDIPQKPVLKSRSFIFNKLTGSQIHVHGSLIIQDDIQNEFFGDIIFQSGQEDNTIHVPVQLHSDLIFNGADAKWQLDSELNTTGNIELKKGALHTNDQDISCHTFTGSGTNSRELDFGSSEIYVEKWDFTQTKNLNVASSPQQIYFKKGFDSRKFSSGKEIDYKRISSNSKASFTISTTTDSATCWTTNDGSFSVTATGGLPPFDYELYDGLPPNTLVDEIQNKNSNTHTFNNLYSGTYFVIVRDDEGDEQAQTNNVPPDTLQIDTIECIKALSCYNSSDAWFKATVSGGTPPYTFTWELDRDADNVFEDTLSSDSAIVTNMGTGVFRVTIEDGNACPTRSVTKPFLTFAGDYSDSIPEQITIDNVSLTPSCVGEDNGSISLTATGGSGEIDYFVVYQPSSDTTYDADGNFSNLAPGDYTLATYDENGCTVTQSETLATYPNPVAVAGSDEATCENTSFDLSGSGVVPDTSYSSSVSWNDDGAPGDFVDPNVLQPVYQPAPGQLGDVDLIMVAQGESSCNSVTDQDTMTLTIYQAPAADAGSDASTCENIAYQINDADTTNASSLNWEILNGDGSLDDANVLDPVYTPAASDASTTVRLVLHTQGFGNCTEATDTMELNVLAAPLADAGADATTCENITYQISDADTTNASSLNWEIVNGNGSLDDLNILDPTYTPAASDAGNTVTLVIHAQGNGNCAEVTDTIQIDVFDTPTADAGSDAVTCENIAYQVNDASTTNSPALNWEILNGNGSLDDPGVIDPTYTPVASDAGTTVRLVLHAFGNSNCAEATDTMDIDILAAPIADAGTDATTCENIAYQINDADTTNASGLNWEIVSGNGSLDDINRIDPTYTPDPSDAGSTVVLVLHAQGNGNCAEVTDTVEILIYNIPTADAGADASTCENIPYQITDADTTNASGLNWEIVNGNGSLDDLNILDPTYTPDASDAGNTVTLVLHAQGNGNCAEETDTIRIDVLPEPTANAGSDASTCENIAYQINDASTSNSSGLNWEIVNGNGSLDDSGVIDPTYTPAVSDAGSTVILVLHAFGNGNCAENTDTLEIEILPAPIANAGSDASTCENIAYQITDADTTNASGLNWEIVNGNGSLDDLNILDPTYTPDVSDAGNTVTLVLHALGNGNCVEDTDTMNIDVFDAPTADAGSDASTCEDIAYQINDANTTNASSLNWEIVNGDGSLDDPGVIDPTYTPVASDAGTTVTLVLHAIGNSNCAEATDTVLIDILASPIADAGSDASTCENVAYQISDADTTNASGLNWEIVNGNGSLDDPNVIDPTYTPDASDAGTTVTLVLHAIGNGNCAEATDTVLIDVYETPSADAGSDTSTCENIGYQINDANTTNASGISWEIVNGNGSLDDPNVIDPTYTPVASDAGNTVVLVLHALGNVNCAEATDTMEISILHAPEADAGADASTCENIAYQITDADTTYSSALNWEIVSGNGSLDDPNVIDPTYTPEVSDAGNTVTLVLHALGNGNCAENTDTLEIEILSAPIANAGTDASTCESIAYQITDADTTNASGLNWEVFDGSGTLDDINRIDPTYTPDPLDAGTTVTLVLHATGNGNCAQASDTMEIEIFNAPVADAGSDEETCEGVDFDLSTSSTPPDTSFASNVIWDDGGAPGTFSDPTALQPVYQLASGQTGQVILTMTAQGYANCSDSADSMVLTITPAPYADAGPDSTTICYGDSVYLNSADTAQAASITWTTSGDGTFDDPNSIDPSYEPGPNDLTNGEVYLYLEASGNGSCNDAIDSIKVNIPPEFMATIGSPSPYLVDETTTDIIVSLKVENHEFIEDLSYYLVSPNGYKLRLASYQSCFTFQDTTQLTFTTTAVDTFDVCSDPLTGTYKIAGDLSAIDGEDPSNGAWRIRVEDHVAWTTGDFEGIISEASIEFIDNHDVTGEVVNVTYKGDDISKPIREFTGIAGDPPAWTEYSVPYGLKTTCYDDCDATAVVFKTGGTPPYLNVEWKDTLGNVISTNDTVTLCAGKYYVEVTDALGCIATDSVIVTQPPEIIIDSLEVLSIDDLNGCHGDSIGEVHDSAYGGTGTLHYELIRDPFATPDTIATNTTGDFTNLAAGEYLLEVYDDNGCLKDTLFTISQPEDIVIVSESFTSLSAPGASDGTIEVEATGGTPPLEYLLYNITPPDTTLENSNNTGDFTALSEGDYYVVVTDANGCDSTVSSDFYIGPMDIDFTTDSVICPGDSSGRIIAEVIGGVTPITYQWTTLSGDTLRILNDTYAVTDTLDSLVAGSYVLNVIDSTGINVRDTAVVYEPDPMIINVSPDTSVLCNNSVDTFWVDITNGVAPYQVDWIDQLSGNPVVTNSDTAVLPAGSYLIEVYDNNGCYMAETAEITEPEPIRIDSINPYYSTTPYGLDVWASGGNDSLLVSLYSFAQDSILYPDSAAVNANQSTFASFDTLVAGKYRISVTDSAGCEPAELTISIPLELELSILDSIGCAGFSNGEILAEVNQGIPPYTYEWSTGDVTNNSPDPTDTLSGLPAGTYSVTVTDSLGITATANIELVEPTPIAIDADIQPAYCNQIAIGNEQGAIRLDVSGGRPYADPSYSYYYKWGNTQDSIAGLDSLVDVGSGSYTVSVYDRYGCSNSESFEVEGDTTYDLNISAGIFHDNQLFIGFNDSICPGDSIELIAVSLQNADSAYWQPLGSRFTELNQFDDSLTIEAEEYKTYSLVARNEKCMDVATAGVIYFWPSPGLNIVTFNGRDVSQQDSVSVLEKDEVVVVEATVEDASAGTGYQWSIPEYFNPVDQLSTELNIAAAQEDGYEEFDIRVETTTQDGCYSSDQLTVSIIPNVKPIDAFSPNGDGINDSWMFKYGKFYENLEVSIFNRWGVRVFNKKGNFETTTQFGQEYIKVWDGSSSNGKELPTGTYYYVIDPHETGVKSLTGTVTIIR